MVSIKKSRPRVPFDKIPGKLPSAALPENINVAEAAKQAIDKLNDLQPDSLTQDAIWRDLLAFQESYRTLFSSAIVLSKLKEWGVQKKCSAFKAAAVLEPRVVRRGPMLGWVDVDVEFTTQRGHLTAACAGIVSVVRGEDGQWRVWMLRTWLEHFVGHGNPDELKPVYSNGVVTEGSRRHDMNKNNSVLDVVIVGGGQSGLGMGGRCQALGLSYVIFDERPETGDSWAKRYNSLRWHSPTHYGHLPFGRTFPTDSLSELPIKQIGAGYKAWADKHEINIRNNTVVESAQYDDARKVWKVKTRTNSQQQFTTTRHLVISTGIGSRTPASPAWASGEKAKASGFKGTILHAVDYRSCAGFEGRRGIVVGSGNTGHDIAEDMADAGMNTTIIQRSPTFVMPLEWLKGFLERGFNGSIAPERSDRQELTLPTPILRQMGLAQLHLWMTAESARFEALEKAGFMIDWHPDFVQTVLDRMGGHYVDIGASSRIVKGEIKVASKPVQGLTRDGIEFEDGAELAADLVVVATGFDHDFRNDTAAIVGHDVAAQLIDCGGVDAEGERRGPYSPAGHEGLWYHYGDVAHARFFSRFVALQIQAELLGQPL